MRWSTTLQHRVRALIRKEFNQIRRDRRLAVSLILPPTLQLLLFGFALSAEVTNIRLGVVDSSRTPESRELIASLSESRSFRLAGYYLSGEGNSGTAISQDDLDAGVVDSVRLCPRSAARTPGHSAVSFECDEREYGRDRVRAICGRRDPDVQRRDLRRR